MPEIYRKTEKGRSEIDTRAHRLAPRLRAALIIVDGHRDDNELARMIVHSDEVLDLLEQQGFVERVTVPPSFATPTAPAPLQAAATATRTMPTAPMPLGTSGVDFVTRKREAARTLTNAVGPVGEPLALQIEKAKEERTLRPLLMLARDSIRNIRGVAAAQSFEVMFLG